MAYGQNAPRCDLLTLKEPGFLDPSHSRGGGRFHPLRSWNPIDETSKCLVLVDSYDPPESIGTKKKYKHTLYDVTVTSCQKHENHQNHGFSLFF